ncbi:2-C-methyl-D-erythritol 4-phosphate cytidylyltransferase [Luteibaculum oceani]|uniref:2-C-methyl-D-erythritol 4-phosphate cytidylyltransferase n=1 Tax=Luteibaculum oceani TaxID=1294296 RepID=A0A5C6VJK4_9FLAO|nr:2-C-methyl-D-erythritol 4-phosphate cytidylyltransferase [Luteibaculum oceani]TXC85110.1 2-C-methyl-D-erythritol 4-phosphate cytidylyltransferase [Luteibaculum oceani]
MNKYGVVIVAGGVGKRMGSSIPKQYLTIKNTPIIAWTIRAFYDWNKNLDIVIVISKEMQDVFQEIKDQFLPDITISTVFGGKERFHSVQNGVRACKAEIIGIHDAVRPLVNNKTLETCYSTAEKLGNAIPFIPSGNSLRWKEGDQSKALDRSKVVQIQTPQCFTRKLINQGLEQEFSENFTDDASVVEAMGMEVNLVEGNFENIKITSPVDLKIAAALLPDKF